jgi:hypothetical protein
MCAPLVTSLPQKTLVTMLGFSRLFARIHYRFLTYGPLHRHSRGHAHNYFSLIQKPSSIVYLRDQKIRDPRYEGAEEGA